MGSGQHMPFVKSVVAKRRIVAQCRQMPQSQTQRAIVQYSPCLQNAIGGRQWISNRVYFVLEAEQKEKKEKNQVRFWYLCLGQTMSIRTPCETRVLFCRKKVSLNVGED